MADILYTPNRERVITTNAWAFLHWLKTVPIGLAFGASDDGLRVMRSQNWTFFEGARTLHLNARAVVYETGGRWRRAAKRVVQM